MSEMLGHHIRVLGALAETTRPYGEYCAHFKTICRESGIEDVRAVRRITRHLARKGLAEYHRALWTEDGEVAGAGYCITIAGLSAFAKSSSAPCKDTPSLPTPAATPTDSANPPPVESVGHNSEAQS